MSFISKARQVEWAFILVDRTLDKILLFFKPTVPPRTSQKLDEIEKGNHSKSVGELQAERTSEPTTPEKIEIHAMHVTFFTAFLLRYLLID